MTAPRPSFRPWKCRCGYVNVIWLRCLMCSRLKRGVAP